MLLMSWVLCWLSHGVVGLSGCTNGGASISNGHQPQLLGELLDIDVLSAVITNNNIVDKNWMGKNILNQNIVNINGVVVSSGEEGLIKGSGRVVTENREIDSISKIKILAPVDVQISQKKTPSLSVIADDNIVPLVKTEQIDDLFVVSMNGSFSTEHGIKVVIGVSEISQLIVKGSADVDVEDALSSELDLQLSGSSDINLTGEVEKLQVKSSGAVSLSAKSLKANHVELTVSGSGDVQVYAGNSIEASVSGMGDVVVYGNPKQRDTSVTGMGEVAFESGDDWDDD